MFRCYTARHRLTLRVFIGIGAVIVLLATACGADGSATHAGARPAGVVRTAAPKM